MDFTTDFTDFTRWLLAHIWGPLGVHLGGISAPLGVLGSHSGIVGGHLGPSWASFGIRFGKLESLAHIWASLGATWGLFGVHLESISGPNVRVTLYSLQLRSVFDLDDTCL